MIKKHKYLSNITCVELLPINFIHMVLAQQQHSFVTLFIKKYNNPDIHTCRNRNAPHTVVSEVN